MAANDDALNLALDFECDDLACCVFTSGLGDYKAIAAAYFALADSPLRGRRL